MNNSFADQEINDVREHRGQVRPGRGAGGDGAEGADQELRRGGQARQEAAPQARHSRGPRLSVSTGNSRD